MYEYLVYCIQTYIQNIGVYRYIFIDTKPRQKFGYKNQVFQALLFMYNACILESMQCNLLTHTHTHKYIYIHMCIVELIRVVISTAYTVYIYYASIKINAMWKHLCLIF